MAVCALLLERGASIKGKGNEEVRAAARQPVPPPPHGLRVAAGGCSACRRFCGRLARVLLCRRCADAAPPPLHALRRARTGWPGLDAAALRRKLRPRGRLHFAVRARRRRQRQRGLRACHRAPARRCALRRIGTSWRQCAPPLPRAWRTRAAPCAAGLTLPCRCRWSRCAGRAQYGKTPLHCAAEKGSEAACTALCELGADVNARDSTVRAAARHRASGSAQPGGAAAPCIASAHCGGAARRPFRVLLCPLLR